MEGYVTAAAEANWGTNAVHEGASGVCVASERALRTACLERHAAAAVLAHEAVCFERQ